MWNLDAEDRAKVEVCTELDRGRETDHFLRV